MKKYFIQFSLIVICFFVLSNCAAIPSLVNLGVHTTGDIIRSGQKDIDIVVSPGITTEHLQSFKKLGISVNGMFNMPGQVITSVGQGTTNSAIFSDMLTKEFMRIGYSTKSISESVSETSSREKLSELRDKGIDLILIGNMNVAVSSSITSGMTGGEYAKIGVNSFTLKGLDVNDGSILFVISSEYGKAKNASEVAKDISQIYKDIVMGNVKQN